MTSDMLVINHRPLNFYQYILKYVIYILKNSLIENQRPVVNYLYVSWSVVRFPCLYWGGGIK